MAAQDDRTPCVCCECAHCIEYPKYRHIGTTLVTTAVRYVCSITNGSYSWYSAQCQFFEPREDETGSEPADGMCEDTDLEVLPPVEEVEPLSE